MWKLKKKKDTKALDETETNTDFKNLTIVAKGKMRWGKKNRENGVNT